MISRAALQVILYFTFGLCSGLVLTLWLDWSGKLSPTDVRRYITDVIDDKLPSGNLTHEVIDPHALFDAHHMTTVNPFSHEQLDAINNRSAIKDIIEFKDHHHHNDDVDIAVKLEKEVRVLCWIMTGKLNHEKKAKHVKATWGKRCNKLIFMSDGPDASLPAVDLDVGDGRDHLTMKTMKAFDYVYEHFRDDYDWFMKADDDTYVIVENLRYLLSAHEPSEPVFFGHHFKVIVKQGYFSGGGGYVLSREALTRFGTRNPNLCAKDHGAEDVEMGRCMEKLGVKTGDSRDTLGRSRFHCFDPETHLEGGYPDWYLQYDKYGGLFGMGNISDYAISFHYVPVKKMYTLEFYVYHLRPYGITSGHQDLNIPPKNRR